MKSPCIKVCLIDPQHGLCKGCFRTLEEIGRWGAMSEDEREQVMARLPSRQTAGSRGLDVAEIPVPPLA